MAAKKKVAPAAAHPLDHVKALKAIDDLMNEAKALKKAVHSGNPRIIRNLVEGRISLVAN